MDNLNNLNNFNKKKVKSTPFYFPVSGLGLQINDNGLFYQITWKWIKKILLKILSRNIMLVLGLTASQRTQVCDFQIGERKTCGSTTRAEPKVSMWRKNLRNEVFNS